MSAPLPAEAAEAVLVKSSEIPEDAVEVRGYDFDAPTTDYDALLQSLLSTGYQATSFGQAVH